MAEAILGPRDASRTIHQPQFAGDGPHVRNTPNMDGAFAELSRSGECYWPTIVYEMAHETVHLLNPIAGGTNILEEGVAVAFSLKAQESYDIRIQQPSMESYLHALQVVGRLPGGPLEAGRIVRERVGALSNVTARHLEQLFPNVDKGVLSKLAEGFIRT